MFFRTPENPTVLGDPGPFVSIFGSSICLVENHSGGNFSPIRFTLKSKMAAKRVAKCLKSILSITLIFGQHCVHFCGSYEPFNQNIP